MIEWELSNFLDTEFCMEALERGLIKKTPEIFNTDQGVQFTSNQFTGRLEENGIKISMDGKVRHEVIRRGVPIEEPPLQ